jgi:class 3 adenylate cyclase/predicted ATPase
MTVMREVAPKASADVGGWLRGLGLAQYETVFRENGIDFELLPKLTVEDLKELGVGAVGHRRKLFDSIAELPRASAQAASDSQSSPIFGVAGAERRQLTVLVCDLVGSTALAARLDPEDMRRILADYDRCCAAAIASKGGYVAKYMGDGVLAHFGYPQAKERDPELAVEAGLTIVESVPELETPAGSPLRVRVGIATGLAVVGDLVGEGESEERGVVGATPILAARLQGIAEPDGVVISEGTRRLLGSLYDLRDLGAVELKGLPAPSHAWTVLRRSAVESRFEAFHATRLTAFVGREDESERLLRNWEKAKASEGQVVLLVGEAGVGKSRLVAEFSKRIETEPQNRLRCYCSPQRQDSTLHPIIGLIEREAAFAPDDARGARLDKLDAFLRRTATAAQDAALLADMLSLGNDGRYAALDIQPRQRRERIMKALLAQIEARMLDRPLLMVVEDAHWADPTTLELLGRLVARITPLRAMLVVIHRPEMTAPWRERSHVTELVIPRLTDPEIGAMIDDVTFGGLLPNHIREEIVRRADGVPLFAEEMTKAVLEGQVGEDQGNAGAPGAGPALSVPPSLQASLMARLDRLGPAKQLAQIAAAIGRVSSYPLLAYVANRPDSELEEALERLVQSGLLLRQGRPPEASYLFKHALLQDLAYGALMREAKRTLHARIAEALETKFRDIGETQPELLAHHCSEAGLSERAATLWARAGRTSLKRSALVEAESHFVRALAEIAAHASTPAFRREEISCQIGLASTLLLRRGYTSTEAKMALSRALALIEQAKALGEAVEDPLALFTTLHGLWVAGIVRSSGDETRQLADQCLALAKKGKAKGERIAGHRAVGQTLLFSGDFLGSRAHFDSAIALFDLSDNNSATRYGGDHWSTALAARAATLWVLGYPQAAQADTLQSLMFARKFGHTLTLGNNLIFAAWTHFCCGCFATAKAQADETVALANEKGEPFYKAFGLLMQDLTSLAEGDERGAVTRMTSTLAAYRASGATLLTAHILSYLANAYAKVGRSEDAWRCIGDATSTLETTNERWCEADILRIAGEIALAPPERDAAQAESYFSRALAVARKQQAKSWELRVATSWARFWRDQGRRAEARDLLGSVYDWFTEGFETRDLKEAKVVLDELKT